MRRDHEYLLWLAVPALCYHVMEEHFCGWAAWAAQTLHFHSTPYDFGLVNALALLQVVVCAFIGWRSPSLALTGVAALATNGIFFHILPTARDRLYSPGFITSVALYVPVVAGCYWAARRDGVLGPRVAIFSAVGGALSMFFIAGLNLTHAAWPAWGYAGAIGVVFTVAAALDLRAAGQAAQPAARAAA